MEQRFVGRYITKGRYVSVHLWFAWGNSVSSSQNDDVGLGQGSRGGAEPLPPDIGSSVGVIVL